MEIDVPFRDADEESNDTGAPLATTRSAYGRTGPTTADEAREVAVVQDRRTSVAIEAREGRRPRVRRAEDRVPVMRLHPGRVGRQHDRPAATGELHRH